jgi:hypothetical protein
MADEKDKPETTEQELNAEQLEQVAGGADATYSFLKANIGDQKVQKVQKVQTSLGRENSIE